MIVKPTAAFMVNGQLVSKSELLELVLAEKLGIKPTSGDGQANMMPFVRQMLKEQREAVLQILKAVEDVNVFDCIVADMSPDPIEGASK